MADYKYDLIIQGNTATWEMKEEGPIEGTYKGTFVFRCFLTPTATLAVGREYRELLGRYADMATEDESFLAYALTQLKYRIIKAPPFWTSAIGSNFTGDIPDKNVLSKILYAAVEAEIRYKENMKEKREEIIGLARKAAEKLLKEREGKDEEASEANSDKS
jgi:hypothetical protein